MKFRMSAEDFKGIKKEFDAADGLGWTAPTEEQIMADWANAWIEAREKECEMVYADCRPVHRKWYDDKTGISGKFGIQAFLWSPQEIGDEE